MGSTVSQPALSSQNGRLPVAVSLLTSYAGPLSNNLIYSMLELERRAPTPLPPIHPEPEYRVTGQRAQWYADMKCVLQVPWMGVVTMAFSYYPNFFELLWKGLRPLAQSRLWVESCLEFRTQTENRVCELKPASILRRLAAIGYAPREIDQIRATIELFSHGNFPYLLIATAARRLLEGYHLGSGIAAGLTTFEGRHAPIVDVPFVLMELHHADHDTRAVYDDIKQTLGLPLVNTDYRALARWPSYFGLAWRNLKPLVGTPGHDAICSEVHRHADRLLGELLPNPTGLDADSLRNAAQRDGAADEILRVVRLFQWLLPGLVTNVALLRAQIAD